MFRFAEKNLIKFSRNFVVKRETVEQKLKTLNPSSLEVEDTSGGCGTFFSISISSSQFEGKSTLQQHKLVQEVLKEEIPQIHGLTLKTKASK